MSGSSLTNVASGIKAVPLDFTLKAKTRNPLTAPSVPLKRKRNGVGSSHHSAGGQSHRHLQCRNPPPMPPIGTGLPKERYCTAIDWSQAELFTWTLASVSYFRLWICIQSCSGPLRLVPCGMMNEALEVVPFGPTTSTGKVMVVTAGGAAGEACRVTTDVPKETLVDAFLAVTLTVVCVATVPGAV